jgi:hypothetical protein
VGILVPLHLDHRTQQPSVLREVLVVQHGSVVPKQQR